MDDREQLAWETANGPRFAVAAIGAAITSLGGFILTIVVFNGTSGNREQLTRIDERHGPLLLARLVQGIAAVLVIVTLTYLFRAVKARRPEGLSFMWPLLAAAPVLLVAASVTGYLDATDAAERFVNGADTSARAKKLAEDSSGSVTDTLGLLGSLTFGLSFVLVSVNAMRAGLLSRFMGVLGLISGALIVLPIVPGSIIQFFWLAALAALFLDRWPNGRGPAWGAVEAIPWPTAADAKGMPEKPTDAPATVSPPAEGEQPKVNPRAGRKRKKKKRR